MESAENEMAETTNHQFFGATNSDTDEEQLVKRSLGASECGAVCAGNFEDLGALGEIGSLEIADSGEKWPLGPHSGFRLDTEGGSSVPLSESHSDAEEDSSGIPHPDAPRIVSCLLKYDPNCPNPKASEIQEWELDFQTLRSGFRNPSARNFTENLVYRTREQVNRRDDFGAHSKDQKEPVDASVVQKSWDRFREAFDLLEFSKTLVDDKK